MSIKLKKAVQLIGIIVIGIFMVTSVVSFAQKSANRVIAGGPIAPPAGYPKLSRSTMTVTPQLVNSTAAVLQYNVEIVNTGAYSASDVTLLDAIPANTSYNNDLRSNTAPAPVMADGMIRWEHGVVGFDDSVVITYSVTVEPGYEGIISNSAVISDPLVAENVSLVAETRVTNTPWFEISSTASPTLPGKNKPLTYELVVQNLGQPAVNTPITVTDFIPANTTFMSAGPGGSVSPAGDVVTWARPVTLGYGETTSFTYTVKVNDVPSGTVLNNDIYLVVSPEAISPGAPNNTKVIDPILILSKDSTPDLPVSNSVVTSTLTVLNLGSKATDLVITDTLPPGMSYVGGGDAYDNGVVSWHLPSLDTGESVQVSITGSIGELAEPMLMNNDSTVCSAEGVCAHGMPGNKSALDKPVAANIQKMGPVEAYMEVTPAWAMPGKGSLLTYKLHLVNTGPADLVGVQVSDSFPWEYTTYRRDAAASTGSLVSDIVSLEWTGDLPGNSEQQITFTAVVDDFFEGVVSNAATISHPNFSQPVIVNAQAYIARGPVLQISKAAAPSPVLVGGTLLYGLDVANLGQQATMLTITDTVPANTTYQPGSASSGGQLVGDTLQWVVPMLNHNHTVHLTYQVTVKNGDEVVNDRYAVRCAEGAVDTGDPVITKVYQVLYQYFFPQIYR